MKRSHRLLAITLSSALIWGCSDDHETPLSPSPIAGSTEPATQTASTAAQIPSTAQDTVATPDEDQLILDGVRSVTVNQEDKRVRNLSAEAGNQQVTLRWAPPQDTEGISWYAYRVDELRWKRISGDASARNATVTDLNGGQQYRFRVRAIYRRQATGGGGFSGPFADTTATPTGGESAQVPEAPTGLTGTFVGDTLQLEWNVPNMRGAELLRYTGRTAFEGWSEWRNLGKTARWSYTSHEPGERREYEVRAVNRIGAGAAGRLGVLRPALSTTKPRNVRHLTQTRLEARRYNLTWMRPSNWSATDPVTKYHYYYGKNCTEPSRPYHVPRSQRDAEDFSINLPASSNAAFSMLAENSAGVNEISCRNAILIEGSALAGVSEPADGDLPSNTNSTGFIVVGGDAVTGRRDGAGDIDWFGVDLQQTRTYVYTLTTEETENKSLSIRTPDGTLILGGAGGIDIVLRWERQHQEQSGRYWVDVGSPVGGDWNYTLTVGEK